MTKSEVETVLGTPFQVILENWKVVERDRHFPILYVGFQISLDLSFFFYSALFLAYLAALFLFSFERKRKGARRCVIKKKRRCSNEEGRNEIRAQSTDEKRKVQIKFHNI